MLNPLIFDKIRGAGHRRVCGAPHPSLKKRPRVRPEQIRVARRLIRDYNTWGTPCGRRWSGRRA